MNGLVPLIQGLTRGEINLVKHIYRIKNSPDRKKRDQSFDLILVGTALTKDDGRQRFQQKNSQAAWSQLESSLKNDILSAILLQGANSKYKTPYAQAAFNCRRGIMQGGLLLGRRIYSEGISHLKKMAKLAITCELVAELITIEDLIRNHLIMKEGVDSFHDSSNSIQESIELLSKIERAKSRHYEITPPALFRTSDSANADTEFPQKDCSCYNNQKPILKAQPLHELASLII
jgi:hypothetical protein